MSAGAADGSVAVVIPTWNAEQVLPRLLASVGRQVPAPREVVVVDNFSDDGTAEMARSAGVRVIQERTNRAEARNRGARLTRSPGLLFLDADMELTPGVVRRVQEDLVRYDALTLWERSVPGINYLAQALALERDAYHPSLWFESPIAFRRSGFDRLGGYNPSLEFREDIDLQSRLLASGLRLGFSTAEVLHHLEEISWGGFVRKAVKYASANRAYYRTDPNFWALQTSVRQRLRALVPNWRRRSLTDVVRLLPGLLAARGLEWTLVRIR